MLMQAPQNIVFDAVLENFALKDSYPAIFDSSIVKTSTSAPANNVNNDKTFVFSLDHFENFSSRFSFIIIVNANTTFTINGTITNTTLKGKIIIIIIIIFFFFFKK